MGGAVAFVSWNWDSEWELLLGALEGHTQQAVSGGAAAPRYWLDLFAVNQHTAALPRRQRGQRKATPRAQLASPVPHLPAHVLQNTAWPHGG